jgi:predicted nucleic acid-binding protein
MAGIALDAGVVIGLYNDKDAHHRWAIDFMFQTTAEKLHISAINYAEIIVSPLRLKKEQTFLNSIRGLGLAVDSVSSSDVMHLSKLRIETGLRMTDVCAIQLAIKHDCPLATTDNSVAKAAKSLGIEVFQP